jgi:transcriptional regulator GlxA family with amidase domain
MQMSASAQDGDIPHSGLLEALVFSHQIASGVCPDPLMERLVRALLPPEEAGVVLRGFYTEAFHSTLLKRLADLRGSAGSDPAGRDSAQLSAWRLKRVSDYVETNLETQLPLADLAKVAGLSRMYFASKFRLATGMRPHEYVIQERIRRAKAMLCETVTPIAEVAFCVGFQSQSHFTTVFKRIVGFTPQHWRRVTCRDDEAQYATSASSCAWQHGSGAAKSERVGDSVVVR